MKNNRIKKEERETGNTVPLAVQRMEHENAGPNANIRQRMEERNGCKRMRGSRRKEEQRRGRRKVERNRNGKEKE